MDQTPTAARKGERRYPGVAFFRDEEIDRHLFFGRERNTYDLLQLILAERLVVLLARSGIGKSSLINAGLMQPLREAGYFPMVVRVSGSSDDPLASLYRGVKVACDGGVAHGFIDSYEPGEPADWDRRSLWHFMKTFCLWRGDELLQPVLIIDQFEEFFTLISDASRKTFVDQLADLVRGTRPRNGAASSDNSEGELSDRPPEVRVLLSIREDFLAHLDVMAGRIPSIRKAHYRLGPLPTKDAERAIVEPAKLERSEIATPPFEWSDEAAKRVVTFLRQRRSPAEGMQLGNEVEPFQLQLICQYVEDLAAKGALETIRLEHLGGERVDATLGGILARFYDRCLTTVRREFYGFRLRPRLERLCEHEFISAGGRRRLCEESSIVQSYRVPREVLAKLVKLRLIRKEERVGDKYYELTHDTLIDPILESRRRHDLRRRWRRRLLIAGPMVLLLGSAGYSRLLYLQDPWLGLVNKPEVLAVPLVPTRIGVGETIDDRLGFFERSGGAVVRDTFEIPINVKVDMRIDVSSDEIDPFLVVRTSNGEILWDDDSGRDLNSSLTVSAEDSVRIAVTSSGGGETGQYRLSITEIPPELFTPLDRLDLMSGSVIDEVPARGELSVGADFTAMLLQRLDAFRGWPLSAWDLQLDNVQSLRVALSSKDFDPYLVVQTPDGTVAVNDDSGGGMDSSLELHDSGPGTVRIITTSYSRSNTGKYRLSVLPLD